MRMDIITIIGILAVGLAAGFLSSLVGIGGGVVVVPAMVLIFGMSQKSAQGTTLAMLSFPVALVGAYQYYKAGNVDWKIAAMLALTFMVGGYLGSKLVVSLDISIVKKIFAVMMLIVAFKYLFLDK